MKTKKHLLLILLVSLVFILSIEKQVSAQVSTSPTSQSEVYTSIGCEELRNLLSELSTKSIIGLEKNVDLLTTGKPAYTVIVISSGNKKNSNAKTARKLVYGISSYINQKRLALRPIIVETKGIKGTGRFQTYFFDKVYDFTFDESTFECQ